MPNYIFNLGWLAQKWLISLSPPMIKIATMNLCLGLKNKKDYVLGEILRNEIDISCLQEVEIESSFPAEILIIAQ